MLYVSTPGEVEAIDAGTGIVKWAFHRKQDIKNPYQNNVNNKGVAVLDGRVFVGTLDDNLIAIDANTGRELWEVRTGDTMEGVQLGGAPLALDGKIIMGMSGGEFGVRGFLDAYDPATGKRLWRTYTIPQPGEAGSETWAGDSWKLGGAPTWLTGSYDPDLHTIYWGAGNPGPDYDASTRKGDNLYTDSVLALDPDTGKIKWHYQFTPNDGYDYDSVQVPVLADIPWNGKPTKVMLWANRNGVFYVIDRVTGKFLLGQPFVKVNWMSGFDANGRPIQTPQPEGAATYPGNQGGTNWFPPSYSPRTGLFYFSVWENYATIYRREESKYEEGKTFLGGGFSVLSPAPGSPTPGIGRKSPINTWTNETGSGATVAVDPHTGKRVWTFPQFDVTEAGLLTTASNLVFTGGREGFVYALDAKTGKELWKAQLGGQINMAPVTYSVDGKQYVAVIAGRTLVSFALRD